ncbi:MAG: hypothetical protein PHQ27_00420, partial [Victivallales bacterium]|nr:hypothetical protein [Victivallales bacterium]
GGQKGQSCRNGNDLKKFQNQCRSAGQELKRAMDRLRQGNDMRPRSESKEASRKQNLDDLQDFIRQNCNSCDAGNLEKACLAPGAGCGGVSRGRGDAPLTWTDRNLSFHGKYRELALPPASEDDLENSELIGVTAAAPEAGDVVVPAAPGSLRVTGGEAEMSRAVIQPRHRRAVGRYFNHRSDDAGTSGKQAP